jgi:hypothetical protein
LQSPYWVGGDQLCLSTGIAEFPMRIIVKSNIIGLDNTKAAEGLQTLWQIAGSRKGQFYLVTREGSRWSCDCVGYGYRKTCSHVRIAKEEFTGEKKLLPSENTSCLKTKTKVRYIGKLKRGHCPSLQHGEVSMTTKTTQAGLALALFQENKHITCQAFVERMVKQFPALSAHGAALYWQKKARRDLFGLPAARIPAEFTKSGKQPKAAKAAKVKKSPKTSMEKLVGDIAAVKAKNLETMREVSKRKQYRSATTQSKGVDNFDADEARAEVAAMYEELESFKSPSFLTKDQVKALV